MFNKTKNYQRHYATIVEHGDGFVRAGEVRRVLLFMSRDAEKVRRRLERENKGFEIRMVRIGRMVWLPESIAKDSGLVMEDSGRIE